MGRVAGTKLRFFALFFFAHVAIAETSPSPLIHSPSPTEWVAAVKISRKDVRRIRREFTAILDSEIDALVADQKRKARESESNRHLRRREWDARENAARRKFFEGNSHGPVLRDYMKSLQARRNEFLGGLKNEERLERSEFEARRKALKTSQQLRLGAVEEYLRRSEAPPSVLLKRQD